MCFLIYVLHVVLGSCVLTIQTFDLFYIMWSCGSQTFTCSQMVGTPQGLSKSCLSTECTWDSTCHSAQVFQDRPCHEHTGSWTNHQVLRHVGWLLQGESFELIKKLIPYKPFSKGLIVSDELMISSFEILIGLVPSEWTRGYAFTIVGSNSVFSWNWSVHMVHHAIGPRHFKIDPLLPVSWSLPFLTILFITCRCRTAEFWAQECCRCAEPHSW